MAGIRLVALPYAAMPQNLSRALHLIGSEEIVFFQVYADADHDLDSIAKEMLDRGCDVTIDRERNVVTVFQGDMRLGYGSYIPQIIQGGKGVG